MNKHGVITNIFHNAFWKAPNSSSVWSDSLFIQTCYYSSVGFSRLHKTRCRGSHRNSAELFTSTERMEKASLESHPRCWGTRSHERHPTELSYDVAVHDIFSFRNGNFVGGITLPTITPPAVANGLTDAVVKVVESLCWSKFWQTIKTTRSFLCLYNRSMPSSFCSVEFADDVCKLYCI